MTKEGLVSTRGATAVTLESLELGLERFRSEVAARVRESDPDTNQIAIDLVVWCHAHLEAARAMREWADATGRGDIANMASAALGFAGAALFGRSAEEKIVGDEALAGIGGDAIPSEDLGATDEHRMLRAVLREFVETKIRPIAQKVHRNDQDVPEAVISGVAALGLFGISIPERFGGSQEARADSRTVLIATEELSRGSLGIGGSLITRPEILVRALINGGTDDQKRRWLPAIADGSQMVAVAVTEPDRGSDVANIKCRASRLPTGEWQITGTKMWCTFAGRAELLMVLCRTGEPGHRGLSIFVLEKPPFGGHEFEHRSRSGGVLRGRAIPTIGYRGMHSFELSFDGYGAPADALLGGEAGLNRGFYLQMEGFAVGRLQTAARAVGVMQSALEAALAYTEQREIFGRREREFQLVLARLGEMAVRTAAARQLSYRAARLMDAGGGQTEAALAKLYASRMAELVARDAMQLHGGMGYAEETEIARHFVDSRVFSIFEGAEEVLSLRVIGRSLLRLK